MSSLYGISGSDLHPDLISDHVYDALVQDPVSGTDVDVDDVIVKAELELNSFLGGTLTESANIALAKPHAMAVAAYRLHARRAANADYKIPDQATADYKSAIDWAKSSGRKLLAAEGAVDPVGTGGVEYSAPAAKFTTTKLDYL